MTMLKVLTAFFGKSPLPPAVEMSAEDRAIIHAFAAGNQALRARAIEIHRKWIDQIGVRGTPEQDFMAEVDHSCPDLALRDHYRRQLLNPKHTDSAANGRGNALK